jgi:hypothetical protein
VPGMFFVDDFLQAVRLLGCCRVGRVVFDRVCSEFCRCSLCGKFGDYSLLFLLCSTGILRVAGAVGSVFRVGKLHLLLCSVRCFWCCALRCVVAGISSADFVEPSGSSVAGRRVRHRDPAGFGLGCWSCVVLSSVSFCLSCSVER